MLKTALIAEILEKVCEDSGEEVIEKSSEKPAIKVPIEVQEISGSTRVIVNMTDIAEILEDAYNGVPKKTEIQMGSGNKVIFDLEPKQ